MHSKQKYFVAGFLTLCCCALLGVSSCNRSTTPKPYAYTRLNIPDTTYTTFKQNGFPFTFALSENATFIQKESKNAATWFNIQYPTLNATIHCTHYTIKNNLHELSDESQRIVYRHASQADAIPERAYENAEKNLYGVLYELHGNTASPLQFILTDSTQNFFRASVYFNASPNQDSIAPVLDYISTDVIRLIESVEWK